MRITVEILVDLEDHFINQKEVLQLSEAIADSYREDGVYVVSFGFLTYKVIRDEDHCTVQVTDGYGYHNAWGGFESYHC